MDPVSLDSIMITEDVDGDGFDLNIVDAPGEFKSHDNDEFDIFQNLNDVPTELSIEEKSDLKNEESIEIENNIVDAPGEFKSHDNDEFNIFQNLNDVPTELSIEEKSDLKNEESIEIENNDIHITLDADSVGKDNIVDLLGFHTDDGTSKSIKRVGETTVSTGVNDETSIEDDEGNSTQTSTEISRQPADLYKENNKKIETADENIIERKDTSVDKAKQIIYPGEKIIFPTEDDLDIIKVTKQDTSDVNIEEDLQEDASFPDMGMQRIRQDSSSGSEFDFELPPVKKKIDDTGTETDTTKKSIVEIKSEQKSEQKIVVIETSQASVSPREIPSTLHSMTANAKKIIEYKEECSSNDVSQTISQKKAAEDWENVQTIEPGFLKDGEQIKSSLPESTPLLSYFEMQEELLRVDHSSVKSNIHISVDRHGFSALKHFLFGPPKMHRNLHVNREKIFCIAASSFNNSDKLHTRALQTIYRCLTGSRFDCSRFGSHWEEIGFQGNDPSTDLRGVGLLGLVNLIYLLRDPKCHMIAKDIYKLSLHPTQNFPFCVMGINMTRITLQSLREDCLNKECNKREDVLNVVNDFYAGIYLHMYQLWKSKGKTISDSGFVIKHLETEAKKNPHHILKNLEDYIHSKKSTASTVNLDNMDPGGDNFLSVCDTEAGQY
ncbi:ELMO domain-containing protein C-like [Mytilus edulis]|uniref:ELMO domain-containing protein C-like n=1 Tax=Mytilus edulis TaxID=6550 RepID=UPI0039F0F9B1